MKKLFLGVMLCSAVLLIGNTASAIPLLQLDIAGGNYDTITESTIGGPTGTLIALLEPNKTSNSDTYFISIALAPKTDGVPSQSINNFSPATTDYPTTAGVSNFAFVTSYQDDSPFDGTKNHGVFDTWYWEYTFQFDGSETVGKYNVQLGDPDYLPEPP